MTNKLPALVELPFAHLFDPNDAPQIIKTPGNGKINETTPHRIKINIANFDPENVIQISDNIPITRKIIPKTIVTAAN